MAEKKMSASFEELEEALKEGSEGTTGKKGEKRDSALLGFNEEELTMTEDEDDFLIREEEEKEIVEEPEEGEKKVEKKKEEVQDEKLKEDLIAYLEESGDTKVTIKGKERDLRDLSPQEIKDRFSKAGRFYERMEELAKKEQELARRGEILEQTASVQRGLEQRQRVPQKASIPDFLKEDLEDTEKEKTLKEGMKTLIMELDTLKHGMREQGRTAHEAKFFADVEKCKKDYPCASIDEVMALKVVRPDIPTEKIMERSHQHYSSETFGRSMLEANPELKRMLYEEAVSEYQVKKGQKTSSKIARRRAASSGTAKVSTKEEGKPKTWEEADERAKAHLRAVKKADEEL